MKLVVKNIYNDGLDPENCFVNFISGKYQILDKCPTKPNLGKTLKNLNIDIKRVNNIKPLAISKAKDLYLRNIKTHTKFILTDPSHQINLLWASFTKITISNNRINLRKTFPSNH